MRLATLPMSFMLRTISTIRAFSPSSTSARYTGIITNPALASRAIQTTSRSHHRSSGAAVPGVTCPTPTPYTYS
jgi:hypothetical protein